MFSGKQVLSLSRRCRRFLFYFKSIRGRFGQQKWEGRGRKTSCIKNQRDYYLCMYQLLASITIIDDSCKLEIGQRSIFIYKNKWIKWNESNKGSLWRPSKKRHLLSRLAKCSILLLFLGSRRLYDNRWERMGPHKLGSLVIGMTANSTQRLQIFPNVYSSSVIVDFIEHD